MSGIIDILFGCAHRNYTFPQTHRCRLTGRKMPMHVTCLDCGAEALYDFRRMVPLWRRRRNRAPKVSGQAAKLSTMAR